MRDPRGSQASDLATDTNLEDGAWTEAAETRIPGLRILFHPDVRRVGERALLPGLVSGATQDLSRLEPELSAPGDSARRPLADSRLSRTPILLEGTGIDGSLRLSCRATRTTVEVDGQPPRASYRCQSHPSEEQAMANSEQAADVIGEIGRYAGSTLQAARAA